MSTEPSVIEPLTSTADNTNGFTTPVTLTLEVTPVLVCAPTASLLASVAVQVIVRNIRVSAKVGSLLEER